MAQLHPFEKRGLGLAPFRFTGMSEKVYCAFPGSIGVAAGTCDYCGTGIRYECHIASSDGHRFVVGTDCVKKIEREDNKLATAVDRAVAARKREEREAARQQRWAARCAQREADLQSQRDRNNGLTDAEVAQQRAEEAARQQQVIHTDKNQWLLAVLSNVGYESGFVSSMIAHLQCRPIMDLTKKCLDVLADIYAKYPNNRRNSPAYKSRCDDFWTLVG